MSSPLKHGITGDNEEDDYKPFIQEGKPSTGVPKFKKPAAEAPVVPKFKKTPVEPPAEAPVVPKFKKPAGKGRKTRRSRRSKRKTNRRFRK